VALEESALRQMLAESVAAGIAAAGTDRIVLDRARVLTEHGVTKSEDAAAFDRFVLGLGGRLRRTSPRRGAKLYWELPRTSLETGEPHDANTHRATASE
jgi:hypothetical protein